MPNESTTTRKVPASACHVTIGAFALRDNGARAKSAPIEMVARSGQPLQHPFWGAIVHDFAGMRLHRDRLPIDYCHDDKEVMGYLNHFDVSSGDLVARGALVPYKDSDRATEVMHKSKAGVPYEASIFFSDGKIEELGEGQVATVNGKQVEGPAVVVREWSLRGVAVCPYGMDKNTASRFANDGEVSVVVMKREEDAMKKAETEVVDAKHTEQAAEAPAAEVVEAPAAEAPAEAETKTEQVAEPEAPATTEPVPTALSEGAQAAAPAVVPPAPAPTQDAATLRKAEGQRFLTAFGARGAVWFAEGLSYEEAEVKCREALLADVAELKKAKDDLERRLAAVATEGAKPVAADVSDAPSPEGGAQYLALAKRYAEEKKVSMSDAYRAVAAEHPELFRAYRRGQ